MTNRVVGAEAGQLTRCFTCHGGGYCRSKRVNGRSQAPVRIGRVNVAAGHMNQVRHPERDFEKSRNNRELFGSLMRLLTYVKAMEIAGLLTEHTEGPMRSDWIGERLTESGHGALVTPTRPSALSLRT
jgi:hypothetical protein